MALDRAAVPVLALDDLVPAVLDRAHEVAQQREAVLAAERAVGGVVPDRDVVGVHGADRVDVA
jgi:hypothetical protein